MAFATADNGRQINLTSKEFTDYESFYALVAGRCNGATLFLTHDQAVAFAHIFASNQEWLEPTILPADYRISSLRGIQVVED